MKKIAIAGDHAGYELKELLVGWLDSRGYEVFDLGCHSPERCDYPDYGHALAEAVAAGEVECGIGLCGSGIGISITLNRHHGVRAGLCWTVEIAELSRRHNDANVCVLPARFVDNDEAIAIVERFLATTFEGGRHASRIQKIEIQ
ncbi:MAG: ribose 5-phosphate isomerase B [Rikenellaceae bacterium]|jgi:ribose 5-phosphate isomerase B|nr:ribose 5-phosphate isomerase B [Rikenellaceae bacterium]